MTTVLQNCESLIFLFEVGSKRRFYHTINFNFRSKDTEKIGHFEI